jgi:hypothetical protein
MTGRTGGTRDTPNPAAPGRRMAPSSVLRRRRWPVIAGAGCVIALALAASAQAVTVQRVRFGDHAGYVRVVVDLSGRRIPVSAIEPAAGNGAADIFSTGAQTYTIAGSGSSTRVRQASGLGVRVNVTPSRTALTIRLGTARMRFKFVRWSTAGAPSRLVFDLYRSTPPTRAASITRDACLQLNAVSPSPGSVAVAGRLLRRVFENQFAVNIRNARGDVLGQRTVTAEPGAAWRVWVPFVGLRSAQLGTVEVLDYNGIGNVSCLVQRSVRLSP